MSGVWRSALRGLQGLKGDPGALVFDASGQVSNARIWSGVVQTNSSGQWVVDYSAAGFSAPPKVQATVVGGGVSASNARNACLSAAPTATGAQGIATSPATISLLGALSVNLLPAGADVHVLAVGKG